MRGACPNFSKSPSSRPHETRTLEQPVRCAKPSSRFRPKFWGIDVFGFGWLLAAWAVVGVANAGLVLQALWLWARNARPLAGPALAGAAIAFLLPGSAWPMDCRFAATA